MREMKNSGVEWIGEIPLSWGIKKFKYVADIYTGNSIKDEEKSLYEDPNEAVPYIATKDIKSVFNTVDYGNGIYIKNDDLSFVRAYSGDTLMCIEGGSAGKKKARIDRTVCFVNKLCCFHATDINSDFLYYILNSPNYEEEFMFNITGLIGGVSKNKLMNFVLPFPSISEQQRISDYLDEKCAKIDAVIEKQKQVIEKLKEYKLSIITEAVTKGLDPTVPMKDSGVKWIGDIPETWKLVKLKYAINKIGDIDHYMPESVDEGIPYLMTGDLKESVSSIDFNACKKVSVEDYQALCKKMSTEKEDIIFARYATIGTVAYVDVDCDFLVSYSCVTIRVNKSKLNGKYLFYYLKSKTFFEEVKKYINANTQGNVGIDSLNKVRMPLPPIDTQKTVVDYIERKSHEIDLAIAKKQAIVEKLTEYKKSLIYEVVTGKREVSKCQMHP